MSLLTGFKFSLLSFLFKFFCSFSLALLTDARLLSLASISSLKALETVNFNSLLLVPNLCFFPSLSPLSLLVALCSANFLFSKSFIIGGVLELNEGFEGPPRLNVADFCFKPVPEDLKEPPFLIKLLFDFSTTTEFFP